MVDNNFQKGDKVTIYHPQIGRIETKILYDSYDEEYPIHTTECESFTKEGLYIKQDKVPSLFHGWNLEIGKNINDKHSPDFNIKPPKIDQVDLYN